MVLNSPLDLYNIYILLKLCKYIVFTSTVWCNYLIDFWMLIFLKLPLTDDIFETGAYRDPSKSQNSTVLGQGGSSSTQSNPSWAFCWHQQLPSISPALLSNGSTVVFLMRWVFRGLLSLLLPFILAILLLKHRRGIFKGSSNS